MHELASEEVEWWGEERKKALTRKFILDGLLPVSTQNTRTIIPLSLHRSSTSTG